MMATESILKNVRIKSDSSARKLVSALEQSQQKSAETTSKGNKTYHSADKKEIKQMFATNRK